MTIQKIQICLHAQKMQVYVIPQAEYPETEPNLPWGITFDEINASSWLRMYHQNLPKHWKQNDYPEGYSLTQF